MTTASATDLWNVDPGPEELQVFPHLLSFVLGVENGQLGEDAHVCTLQSYTSLHLSTTSQPPSPHLSTSPVLADTQHNIYLSNRYRPAATRQYARAPTPMAVQRWHIVLPSVSVHGSKNRGRSMRWLGPQSAHLWWLAVAKLQAASVPIA